MNLSIKLYINRIIESKDRKRDKKSVCENSLT